MSVQYILHVCLPDEEEQLVDIESKLVLGSDEGCDVCYPAPGIDPQHLTFRVNNGVLTVKNHSTLEPTLGKTPIKKRKMVIIDEGDSISLGELVLKISKNDDDEGVDMSSEDELPTATTLFKLAKAELEALDSGEEEVVSSEDKTGEVDVQAMVEEGDEDEAFETFDPDSADEYDEDDDEEEEEDEEKLPPKKKRGFLSFLSFFKTKKKKNNDEDEDDEEDDEEDYSDNISDESDTSHDFKLADEDDEEEEENEEDLLPEEDDSEVEFEEPIDTEEEPEESAEELEAKAIPVIPSKQSIQATKEKPAAKEIKKGLKKPSLFKRLKNKFKKSSPSDEIIKKKRPPLGLLTRIYAVAFNYLAAYMLYIYFGNYVQQVLHHPILDVVLKEPSVQEAIDFVLPYWIMIPDEIRLYLVKLFPIYLVVVAQDILFSLILGLPLPLWALGASSKGSFLFKRLSSLTKAILNIFHPLLILDLPLLVSLPSLKEVLSFSRYYRTESKIYGYLGPYIVMPLMFVLTLSSGILVLDSFSEFGITKSPKQTLIQKPVATPISYKSQNYGFIMNNIEPNIFLLPVNYNDFDNSFYVKLMRNEESLVFKVSPFPYIDSLMNYIRTHNPIVQFFYPAPAEPAQLEKLISTTFDLALNPDSLVAILAAQGPLIIPAIKAKKRLFKILEIQNIDSYGFINTKVTQFLQIKEGLNTHLIALSPPYLHISYAKKGNSKSLLNDFPEILLSNFTPYLIKKKTITKEKSSKSLEVSSFDNGKDPFIYLDLIINPNNCELGNDYYKIYQSTIQSAFANNKQNINKEQFQASTEIFTKLHTQLYQSCLNSKKRIERETSNRKNRVKRLKNKKVQHQKNK